MPGEMCPRCILTSVVGDQEAPQEILERGPKISGLDVHAEVGEGGFGVVYRASQTGTVRRNVALKVLKPGVDTRQVLRRFEIEGQALSLLDHPNIARFYEAGQSEDGYPFFTMELIEGVPIHEALGGRSAEEILAVMIPVCEAVGYAHERGMIHRDLKPGNILVTAEGVPKVIDFGLAKALDAEQAPGMTCYTGGESWLGTPGYSAPEQLDRSEVEPDERVDTYSLGAIFYHLLTGLGPKEALALNDDGTLPKPSLVALQKIPDQLDAIVMHSLETERGDRYQSVRELIMDLRRFLNGDPISLKSPGRRVKIPVWPLVAVVLLLVVGGIWWSQTPEKPSPGGGQFSEKSFRPDDLTGFLLEKMDFVELDGMTGAIDPFENSEKFCWMQFKHPDGRELTVSFDSEHDSPHVTELLVGGRRPDDEGVRAVEIGSKEDQALVELIREQRSTAIGDSLARELEEMSWEDLESREDRVIQRKNKLFLGALYFFENHRLDRMVELEK